MSETVSLKAFAHKVLQRNTTRNKCETDVKTHETKQSSFVSPVQCSKHSTLTTNVPFFTLPSGRTIELSSYIALYNEKVNYYEHILKMDHIDVEWKAMNDTLNQFAIDNHLSTRDKQVWMFCHDLIAVTGFRP